MDGDYSRIALVRMKMVRLRLMDVDFKFHLGMNQPSFHQSTYFVARDFNSLDETFTST